MKVNLLLEKKTLADAALAALLVIICSLAGFAQSPCGEQDYDCQIASANKNIRANPNDADAYFGRGNAYYNKGDYESSIKDYSKTLELNPEKYQAYDYRADAYYHAKHYDQAISDYTKSIELDPEDPDTYVSRGNAYDTAGNFDAAMKDYNKAIKLDPRSANAYYNRGIALLFKDKNKEAIADFQKALQIKPDYTAAQEYLEKAQAAKQEKDARSKAKWAAFGQAIDQITSSAQQNTAQSNGAPSTSGNARAADSQTTTANRSAGGSPTEADVKAWVKAYEDEINPTGGVSSPLSISLSFNQISYGAVRAANEGDRLRKVKSDQLYMVIVDYTVNQKFSDGTYPKRKNWKFEFYVNNESGWSAFNYGPAQ